MVFQVCSGVPMTSRFKGPLISRWWRLLDIIGGKDIVGRLAWLPAFIRDTDVTKGERPILDNLKYPQGKHFKVSLS